jgi:hypothetical protein
MKKFTNKIIELKTIPNLSDDIPENYIKNCEKKYEKKLNLILFNYLFKSNKDFKKNSIKENNIIKNNLNELIVYQNLLKFNIIPKKEKSDKLILEDKDKFFMFFLARNKVKIINENYTPEKFWINLSKFINN